MSPSIWQDNRVSIVLLPGGTAGKDLAALVTNWADSGLLAPAMWIHPEDVVNVPGAPAQITATVIGAAQDRSVVNIRVPLFDQLAVDHYSKIRLIKVKLSTKSNETDEIQDSVVTQLERYLHISAALPQDDPESEALLDSITLVIPSTEYRSSHRITDDQRGAGFVIVAAPEDRSSPWSPDAFVRDGKRFNGFILMHIATVAGLWNGLPAGNFDLVKVTRRDNTKMWLSRVFVSAILTDRLARRISAEVVRDLASPGFTLEQAPQGTTFISDQDQDGYVDSLVNSYFFSELEGGILTYRAHALRDASGKLAFRFWHALWDFTKFAWLKLAQIPRWAWRRIRQKSSQKLQETLYTEDGIAEINPEAFAEELDGRDLELFRAHQTLHAKAEEAYVNMMAAPIRKSLIRSTPGLWTNIRTRLFAVLDGSDAASNGFPPLEGNVLPVFRNVGTLFMHPDDRFTLPQDMELPEGILPSYGWDDLEEAMEAPAILAKWQREPEEQHSQAEQAAISAMHGVERIQHELDTILASLREKGATETDELGVERPITLAQASGKAQGLLLRGVRLRTFAAPTDEGSTEDDTVTNTESQTNESTTVSPRSRGRFTIDVIGEPGRRTDASAPKARPKKTEPEARDAEPIAAAEAQADKPTREQAKPSNDETLVITRITPGEKPTETTAVVKKKLTPPSAAPPAAPAAPPANPQGTAPQADAPQADAPQADQPATAHAPASPQAPETASASAPSTSSPSDDVADLIRRHKALKKELKEALAAQVEADKLIVASTDLVAKRQDLTDLFTSWYNGMERTLTWRIRRRMRAERAAAQADVDNWEIEIKQINAPEPGTLVKLRKAFHKSLLVYIPTMFLIAGLIVLAAVLGFFEKLFPLVPGITSTVIWWTMFGLIVSVISGYIGYAIRYYVGHSIFVRSTETERVRIENTADGYANAQSELLRLTELHAQTMDWLDLLARVMHHPWKAHDSWLESAAKELDTGALPFAMRIAQANDDDSDSRAKLRAHAIRMLTRPGWRKKAFEEFVAEVGRSSNELRDSFSVETLDNDLPHVTNGARKLVRQFSSDEKLLERVGLHFMRPAIDDLQTNAMTVARPPVRSLDENPLSALKTDMDGLSLNEYTTETWDEFLSTTVIRGRGMSNRITPLSELHIDAVHRVSDVNHDVTSVTYVPEHMKLLIEESDTQPGNKATIETYEGSRVRPIDAVIRIDVVGPVDEEVLNFWSTRTDESEPDQGNGSGGYRII